MKNTSLKTLSAKTALTLCLTGILASYNTANAQPPGIAWPGNSDIRWVSGMAFQPLSLNTAAIAYREGPTTNPLGIYACALPVGRNPLLFPPSGIGEIHLLRMNNLSTTAAATAFTSDISQAGIDLVLGNTDNVFPYNPCNDFIMAAAYADGNSNPRIDFFKVSKSPGLTVTYINNLILPAYTTYDVHIDVMAAFNDLRGCAPAPSLPYIGKFMITFTDIATGDVKAAYGDLTTRLLGGGGVTTIDQGTDPDIAAVQRGSSPITNMGYVTYIGASGGLYSCTFDPSGSAGTPVLLDASATTGVEPRIDAVDNYALSSSVVQYKVVASILNSSTPANYEIRTYDDITSGYDVVSQYTDFYTTGCSSFPTPYHSMTPQISVWGTNNYGIIHDCTPVSTTPQHYEMLAVEPIDDASPISYWTNTIYKVNDVTPCAEFYGAAADFRASAASCPNYLGLDQPVLFAWNGYDIPPVGTFYTNYKFTQGTPATPSWSGFKTGSTTLVSETIGTKEWSLFPNPTSEILSVTSPEGTVAKNYEITDVLGKTVQKGNLSLNTDKINISKLLPGIYSIKLQNDRNDIKSLSFVKN
ncbi:MAG: hypothetical protein JWQ38_1176 [Flavipsychrobacter sp.]|nr:hypothetical protein [Flavipsychrobacter sp.]